VYGLDIGFIDHLYTPLRTTLHSSLTHTETSGLSLLRSPLAVSWQRLLSREILQLPTLRSSYHSHLCRTLVNWQLNQLGPRLAAISHQSPSLLFTGWLSTELSCNWTLSLTNLLLHVTWLNWTADNSNQLHCFVVSCCPAYNISTRDTLKTPFPLLYSNNTSTVA
jgi:hypothetical protein